MDRLKWAIILLSVVTMVSAGGGGKCSGIWYTSETCDGGSCCEKCTKNKDCACLAEAKKGTGIAKGTVKHATVKKYPTVVFIEEITGKTFDAPSKKPLMDQKGKVFLPVVLPVLVGTTVDFANSDDIAHNVFSPDNEKYDLGNWGKGEIRSYTFKRAGAYTQLCSLHPEMIAYVVACKTPYFVVADGEGHFRIPNVPAGTWKLKIWNERLKAKQLEKTFEIKVEEGKEVSLDLEP